MAAKVAQYVTVIDRSNKVIGNSRQFKDVFFEAKAAYQDRKAEIKAKKRVKEEEELQKAIRAVSIQDQTERGGSTIRPDGPRRQSTTHGRRSPPTIEQRPRAERIHSSASPRSSGHTTPREGARGLSLGEFNDQIYGPNAPPYAAQTPAPWEQQYDPYARGLVRSQTDVLPYQHQQQQLQMQHRPSHPMRSQSVDEHVDMDLAYGEYHPESLAIQPEDARKKELSSLVTRCKGLLDEADCAGHSAKAIIEHLQKNPDTLAAVGLTLAEISSVASKMAPGALAAIGKSAPAVMALLMSPQFLIAVGVGVGVTVIAIGGFKIIKKIKARGAEDDEINRHVGPGQAEAIDVRELSRIEAWRRGVPESVVGGVNNDDTGSVISGTTVEGEFITPFAAQSMGHLPPGKSTTSRSKTVKKSSQSQSGRTRDMGRESESGSATGKSERKKKHRKHRSDGEDDTSSVNSKDSSGSTLRRAKTERSVVKVKKPSPLSRMFTTGTSTRG